MPVRRLAVACACSLALALPGQALAQGGAGDQQYTDPFGSQSATPTPRAAPRPAVTAAPPPVATAVPTTAAAATPAAPAVAGARQLPYTGAPTGLVGAAGALLVAGGAALRARAREQR